METFCHHRKEEKFILNVAYHLNKDTKAIADASKEVSRSVGLIQGNYINVHVVTL